MTTLGSPGLVNGGQSVRAGRSGGQPGTREAQLATLDLRRRAWKILVRMRWEDPDVTAARRTELDHELARLAARERRKRRAEARAKQPIQ